MWGKLFEKSFPHTPFKNFYRQDKDRPKKLFRDCVMSSMRIKNPRRKI